MTTRYVALKPILIEIEYTEVKGLLLTDVDDEDVDELLCRLQYLNSITVTIQEDKTTVRLARMLFAGAKKKF